MKQYIIDLYGKEITITQNEDGTFNKPQEVLDYVGFGTATKPSHEPICMARKPLAEKTVAENCLKWGTGGIDIETSRVTSNLPPSQNNQDYENVCNEFSYIQQSYLLNLSDTFFLTHELSQDYLRHIFFVLSPYNNCNTITLHTEVVLAHNFDKGLQDALCGYGLKVQRVDEYVQNVIKAPNFQDDYPTLFSFCDGLLQKKVIPFKDVVALSNDVRVHISDFINSGENITPFCNNLLNSFFVVFPYIIMLINKTPTLYLFHQKNQENIGRFPANLIHDNSEEVRECFPETKSGARKGHNNVNSMENSVSIGNGWKYSGDKCEASEGNASRFFKSIIDNKNTCNSDQKQYTMNDLYPNNLLWKNTFVDNAERLLKIIQAIIENTALLSADDSQEEKLNQLVKNAEKNADLGEIVIALNLVAIKGKQGELVYQEVLNHFRDYTEDYKKCSQILSLVKLVEISDNTDITEITANLLKLFGSAQYVTEESTHSENLDTDDLKGDYKSLIY